MIIYEVKIKVDPSIESDFLEWMKKVHVPDVIGTGLIASFQILKSIAHQETTYHYQYQFKTIEDYELYQKEHSQPLRADVKKHYPSGFSAERALYEIL